MRFILRTGIQRLSVMRFIRDLIAVDGSSSQTPSLRLAPPLRRVLTEKGPDKGRTVPRVLLSDRPSSLSSLSCGAAVLCVGRAAALPRVELPFPLPFPPPFPSSRV